MDETITKVTNVLICCTYQQIKDRIVTIENIICKNFMLEVFAESFDTLLLTNGYVQKTLLENKEVNVENVIVYNGQLLFHMEEMIPTIKKRLYKLANICYLMYHLDDKEKSLVEQCIIKLSDFMEMLFDYYEMNVWEI